MRAFFALGTLKKPESFYSWLLSIADRVTKEALRSRKREITNADVASHDAGTLACQGEGGESVLRDAVTKLPEAQRQVVLLRFYAGLSCREIASSLDLPISTVTSRLSRAYGLLRKALSKSFVHKPDLEMEL